MGLVVSKRTEQEVVKSLNRIIQLGEEIKDILEDNEIVVKLRRKDGTDTRE